MHYVMTNTGYKQFETGIICMFVLWQNLLINKELKYMFVTDREANDCQSTKGQGGWFYKHPPYKYL